jgi:hypothetical protein
MSANEQEKAPARDDIRRVVKILQGVPAEDGAGVKLTRIIGTPELDMWDPFLLLDRFESDDPEDYIAGFPAHPHRGFETVTYLLAGRLRHKDSTGREGIIEPGGVQWMTAARGIVHSEMPEQVAGRLAGFQLWVNLPAEKKMSPPGYQEFSAEEIPLIRREPGVEIRVIAGTIAEGVSGPVKNVPVNPQYLDIGLKAGKIYCEPVTPDHAAFIYVIQGSVGVIADRGRDDITVASGRLALLGQGAQVQLCGETPDNRLLLISGMRLAEPVARSGPFVMNTRDEILQAFADYRSGRF